MNERRYRLEIVGRQLTSTFTTEEKARDAAKTLRKRYNLRPDDRYCVTLRSPKGRKTTLVCEGVVP